MPSHRTVHKILGISTVTLGFVVVGLGLSEWQENSEGGLVVPKVVWALYGIIVASASLGYLYGWRHVFVDGWKSWQSRGMKEDAGEGLVGGEKLTRAKKTAVVDHYGGTDTFGGTSLLA
jgi:hypothetical protein